VKSNQYCFGKILFHLPEVFVNIDFAHEKKMFLTCFAQRKFFLWITGGLDLQGQIDLKLQYEGLKRRLPIQFRKLRDKNKDELFYELLFIAACL